MERLGPPAVPALGAPGLLFFSESCRYGPPLTSALRAKLRREDPAMGGAGGVYIARWEASEMDRVLYGIVGLCVLVGLVALAALINVLALIAYM